MRLQFVFLALHLIFFAGQVLSAPLIQCSDWQQYVVQKAGAILRSSPLKQSFELAVVTGKAVHANAKPPKSNARNRRTEPFPLPKGFWNNGKPGLAPVAVEGNPALGFPAVWALQAGTQLLEGGVVLDSAGELIGEWEVRTTGAGFHSPDGLRFDLDPADLIAALSDTQPEVN